jgi:hypothetical protein
MRNERLVTALRAHGLTDRGLAAQLSVDPKTVERWQHGRIPQPRHRQALAALLAQPEAYLWPAVAPTVSTMREMPGLMAFYPRRSDVPLELWHTLLARVPEQVDVLAYAALFLAESNPDLVPALRATGVGRRVRFALGDPVCDKVLERTIEEGLDMSERIRTMLRHLRPLAGCEHIEIRLHRTTLYNSLFRFDDDLLVNHHAYGVPAYQSPVMHVRRSGTDDQFSLHVESFETIWGQATPLDLASWSSR